MSAPDRRALIDRDHRQPSIRRQCALLGVARSGVYRRPSPANDDDLALMRRIDELFTAWPFLGSRRMMAMLRAEGHAINRKRVQRLMRRMGIAALGPKPRTTKPAPGHKIFPYLLRNLVIDRPNQVWAADITYIPIGRGFLYLVAVIDWASRAVLAWRLSNTMDVSFCVSALEEALARFGRPEIFNTDQSLMGWMAPERHLCAKLGMQLQRRGPSMTQVTTIGLDLAKRVFQVHGVDAAGAVVLRRQLKRRQMVPFFTKLPSCLIGMEACGTAHHWGRTLRALGHEVRLIPPAYAKAYVRRNKTDPADAEAICEAVSRPSMRFVPIKSEADQAMAAVHRVRERLIAQRTQTINMLRGQMAEFGVVAAKGPQHVKGLLAELVEPESVPEPLRQVLLGLVRLLTALREQIAVLDKQILAWHQANPCSRRLSGIDGFGPILSSALALRVQEPQRFACGRDLSAWIGLAPKQNSSGGKIRLGAISKKGDVYLRRLLINGAQAVLNSKRAKDDPWIARLLQTKPRLVAAVALANKMARVAWAVMVRRTDFRRAPAAA